MLDIEAIRADPRAVAKMLSRRGKDYGREITRVFELDLEWRSNVTRENELNAERNALAEQTAQAARAKKPTESIKEAALRVKDQLKELSVRQEALATEMRGIMLALPNIPSPSVIDGASEEDNLALYCHEKPGIRPGHFLDHWTYAEQHALANFVKAVRMSGQRQVIYTGNGAKLVRALKGFMLDTHTKDGYAELAPPDFVNAEALTSTGQLPKFEEDLFKVADGRNYLSPTGEVQLTNFYADTILQEDQLPIKMCGFTHCFRAEAGSAGRDVKGVIRLHQFRKVELVQIVDPDKSYEHLEELSSQAEKILKLLRLPYRKVLLSTGDMGFGSAMTYDLEVWMPSYQSYKEISSITNFEGFQARRGKIRMRRDGSNKSITPHTLNASGLSIDRTWAAIVENFQDEKGRVKIPDVLVPYMGGLTYL